MPSARPATRGHHQFHDQTHFFFADGAGLGNGDLDQFFERGRLQGLGEIGFEHLNFGSFLSLQFRTAAAGVLIGGILTLFDHPPDDLEQILIAEFAHKLDAPVLGFGGKHAQSTEADFIFRFHGRLDIGGHLFEDRHVFSPCKWPPPGRGPRDGGLARSYTEKPAHLSKP